MAAEYTAQEAFTPNLFPGKRSERSRNLSFSLTGRGIWQGILFDTDHAARDLLYTGGLTAGHSVNFSITRDLYGDDLGWRNS